MGDCIFFVADKNMEATFSGFLSRHNFHLSLGCGPFQFSAQDDLFVAAGQNDPGLFTRAGELLSPFLNSHKKAVVALDCAWDGSPGQAAIKNNVAASLISKGWQAADIHVVAIEPELEQWIWQNNVNVEVALGHTCPPSLQSQLQLSGQWPAGMPKPTNPKEVLEEILKKKKIPRSSAIYQKISSRVSVGSCTDPEFVALKHRLAMWFP